MGISPGLSVTLAATAKPMPGVFPATGRIPRLVRIWGPAVRAACDALLPVPWRRMAEGGLLVQVAKSQLGNQGGQPYWSWYGFESRQHGAPALSAGARTSVGIWRQGLSLSSLPARKGSGGSQRGDSIIRVTMYRNPGTWCSLTGEVMAATTMWGSWNMWRRGWCTPLKGTQATAVQSVRIPLETAVSAVSEVWGSYK